MALVTKSSSGLEGVAGAWGLPHREYGDLQTEVHPVMTVGPLTNGVALKETRPKVLLLVTTIFSLGSSSRLYLSLTQLRSVRCE